MLKRYRILEVDGKFIPQVNKTFLSYWVGIDLHNWYEWYELSLQISYCSKKTIEEARIVIDKWIEKNKKK